MKIGIVTFYSECNYGAFLQALGLMNYLKSLGHDVKFINYAPNDMSLLLKLGLHDGTFFQKIRRRYNIYYKYKMKRSCKEYLNGFEKARLLFFEETQKLNHSNMGQVISEFDVICVGSDQVWNMRRAGKEKLFYFLDFFKSGNTKKISYAACFGQYYQKPKLIPAIKKALRDFNAISVRNEVSKKLVQDFIGKDVPVVCDPTVLLWNFKFAESNYVEEHDLKDYLLVYCLDSRQKDKHEKCISYLRKKCGKKIVSINSSYHTAWALQNADVSIDDATPMDWLSLFSNAYYIYTDSYHGAIFSLMYKKSVLIMIEDNERADRLRDLSIRYSVKNRLCLSLEDVKRKYDSFMDYEVIFKKMYEHRRNSIYYLEKALS